MSRNFTTRSIVAVALVATATACAKPPSETISAAEEAQQTAVATGAAEYAPEAMTAVAEAQAALQAELAAQEGRWAVRRSYDRAEELAAAYRQAGEEATRVATAAKRQAQEDATRVIAESRLLLDELSGMLAVAPVGKGSRADLAALKTDLEAATTSLNEAEAALGAERYLEAQSKATAARETMDRVRLAIEQARGLRSS